MSDISVPQLIQVTIVPVLTAATAVSLFWGKLYADARKRLDDLLIELEHELTDLKTDDRSKVFRSRYLEIRKAITEYDRWILDGSKKRRLKEAYRRFRGQSFSDAEVFTLLGTPHEDVIDSSITYSEVRCLTPLSDSGSELINRIAALRKITGSRKWDVPPPKVY